MWNIYKKQILLVLSILFFKVIILAFLPLTGDEAYFIKWAQNLDWGYYDHPPMVGWLIYILSYVNDSYIFFRLFSFFSTLLVAYLIYKIALLYKNEKQKSFYLALIFLVSPIDILITLFTNDIPLILFGTLGFYFLILSLEKEKWFRYSVLAGVFLGFCFLSKYFAAFLMISLVLLIFIEYKTAALKNFFIVFFVVLISILENLYFNYNSCWNNIMFNFFARTEESEYNISTLLGYFSFIIYLLTPWGIYYIVKKSSFENKKMKWALFIILGFVFLVFLWVSLKNRVGLHWFLLFIPYMYLLYIFIDKSFYPKLFKYNYIFTLFHILLLLVVIFIPKSYFENSSKNKHVVFYTQPQEICSNLAKYETNKLFTFGYDTAALLSYQCKRDIKMLFNNNKYGRLDDKLLDVRELDGKEIDIFNIREYKEPEIYEVCGEVSVDTFTISKAKYYVYKCKDFKYEKYKKHYLDIQKEKFYNIPSWLPVGKCYFSDKYYKN